MNGELQFEPAIRDRSEGMVEQGSSEGKYVYCIIRDSEPIQFTTLGIGERGDIVHTVHFKDLAAVVSDSPVIDYDQSRRNMMAHTKVLEEVMAQFAILPVRFGTVAPTLDAVIEKVLKRRREELEGLLQEIDDRVELGLKAFWYEKVIFQEVVEEHPTIRELRNGLMDRPPEETYYERIRLGEMIEAAMERKREEDAAKIIPRLRRLAYRSQINDPFTDRMVVNAAFLVDGEREAEFDQVIEQLDSEMGDRFMFKYVGPVPPYNFVNVVVHWDE